MTEMNKHDHAIRLLAKGFESNFADFCAGDERMHDLMMDLAEEFVKEEVPIVNDDDQVDLATELIMSVTVKVV